MKIAVLETGGKQYLVEEGSKIEIEKLSDEPQKEIVFSDVLLYADDEKFLLGQPKLNNVKISGELLKVKKNKTIILKYKPKTRYLKKKGYKKITWIVKIREISLT
jgi:large subunit ribosomal protein L21